LYLVVQYPSTTLPGPTNLVNQYTASVDQIKPVAKTNVAQTHFFIILTDSFQYVRTQTVGIHAIGYSASDSVNVTIRPSTSSTLVFSQTMFATLGGVVDTSWRIPSDATLGSYLVSVTGKITVKNPPDVTGFSTGAAPMTISALTSLKSTYQRTETMQFSFQATYPDGSLASTGTSLVTLARPDGVNVTLGTTYDTATQSFVAKYKTSVINQTGSWTATLAPNSYNDGNGNTGPATKLMNNPQLVPAILTANVNATAYVPIGQQVKFNATFTYPDGTTLQTGSGTVTGSLIYSGTPTVTDTFSGVFDSGLKHWFGSYTPKTSDPGGLWSLVISGSDTSSPSNSGTGTKAVTLQDRPPVASFTSTPSSAPTATAISFNGMASYDPDGTVVSYSWDFGDQTTGTGSIVSHSYTYAKTYTVTLTVTDNGGVTGSTMSQVTITDRPPAVRFTPSPGTANTGQSVTLSITVNDPDGTISTTGVDWGDGTIQLYSGAITSATHSYSSTGSSTSKIFTIIITGTDNNASSTSTSSPVTINDRVPSPSFNPSSTVLSTGQNVTLTISASDPDGTVTAIKIDWGDGTIDSLSGTATSDAHSYSSTGTSTSKSFTITVNATDNSGSTGKYSSQVTVSDRPPVIAITSSPSSVSTGQTVTVSITSSDPDGTISSTKVDWGDGTVDALTGAPQRDTHQYSSTGSASSKTFAISITVTDNSGSTSAPSTSTVSVQASSQSSSGTLSLPLYYFAILAAVVAVLLVGGFVAFRRHKITHANLKIDLEAVKSEAGRIENQEFFQSVKDQLKKDKDD
jgi:PKD repeat protein